MGSVFKKRFGVLLLAVAALCIGCISNRSAAETVGTKPVCTGTGKACDLLNEWFGRGKAAGNIGDWYDNRDRGHSRIRTGNYPQLAVVEYTDAERSQGADWGAQKEILKQITVGNSSTSANVESGGSQPRATYYTRPGGLGFLYAQYRHSNLYVYPEHRDYDPGRNGRPAGYGDLYPTNTPYLVISQGSSGSDRVFVDAFINTLAAFKTDVKERLYKTGLLMPTLQMIFRTANRNIRSKDQYLSGIAHPAVFQGKLTDPLKMVETANRIELDDVPPLVQLAVVEEDRAVRGMDYFEAEGDEKLADTPSVIARIFRRTAHKKRMVVSAEQSADLNQRPLTYHWVVLQGDRDKITIMPQKGGALAELVVAFHSREDFSENAPIESNRVDIGVFVHNGVWYSAPGFITFFFLDNEARTYHEDGRLADLYYSAADTEIGYDTRDFKRFLAKDYDIYDWGAAFEMVGSDRKDLPARLLNDQFTRSEKDALHHAGLRYLSAQKAETALNETMQSLNEALKQLNKDKEGADEAKKQEIIESRKSTQQNIKEVHETYKKIFLSDRIDAKGTVKQILERALNNLKNDVFLFIDHSEAISAIAGKASETQKKMFADERKRLENMGLLKVNERHGFTWHSVRIGEAALEKRLTMGEKNLIRQFNLFILNQILYPEFLHRKQTVNFVDSRVTTPKPWRDVYRYSEGGDPTGWTRFDGRTVSDYTPAGNLVKTTDPDGRVSKVQPVEYRIDTKRNILRVAPREQPAVHGRAE